MTRGYTFQGNRWSRLWSLFREVIQETWSCSCVCVARDVQCVARDVQYVAYVFYFFYPNQEEEWWEERRQWVREEKHNKKEQQKESAQKSVLSWGIVFIPSWTPSLCFTCRDFLLGISLFRFIAKGFVLHLPSPFLLFLFPIEIEELSAAEIIQRKVNDHFKSLSLLLQSPVSCLPFFFLKSAKPKKTGDERQRESKEWSKGKDRERDRKEYNWMTQSLKSCKISCVSRGLGRETLPIACMMFLQKQPLSHGDDEHHWERHRERERGWNKKHDTLLSWRMIMTWRQKNEESTRIEVTDSGSDSGRRYETRKREADMEVKAWEEEGGRKGIRSVKGMLQKRKGIRIISFHSSLIQSLLSVSHLLWEKKKKGEEEEEGREGCLANRFSSDQEVTYLFPSPDLLLFLSCLLTRLLTLPSLSLLFFSYLVISSHLIPFAENQRRSPVDNTAKLHVLSFFSLSSEQEKGVWWKEWFCPPLLIFLPLSSHDHQ